MLLVLSYSSAMKMELVSPFSIIFHSSSIHLPSGGYRIAIQAPCAEVYRGLLNGAPAAIKARDSRDRRQQRSDRHGGLNGGRNEAVTDDVNIAEEVRLLKRQELKKKLLKSTGDGRLEVYSWENHP